MGWYLTPGDRERAAIEALKPGWERMRRDKEREAIEREERLREMWDGIAVGDVVELTEEEGMRRGRLRMLGSDGEVELMQVRVIGIEGEFARVRVPMVGRYGGIEVEEMVGRGVIRGVVKEGLVVRGRGSASVYWDEGE